MRYTILFSIFLIVALTGCNKDKYNTTPSLEFKDVNTRELQIHNDLVFTLKFTDAEGDLTDSIYVEEYVPYCPGSSVGAWYALPSFPTSKNQKGEITVNFSYNSNNPYTPIAPQCQMNDTAVFRFALKDKAQHISDTISSPQIVIVYP
jgi:hypothetical protein